MNLIGIEEHWTPAGIDSALKAQEAPWYDDSLVLNEHGDAGERLADLGAGRLAHMDSQGLDLQVLGVAPPGPSGLPGADAVPLSREANDRAAELIAAHPDRFRAMATLPLGQPAAAAAELERAAGLGLTGVMVYGRTGDVPLDDPRLDDLWQVAEALRQPIFIHPQIPPHAVRETSYSGIGKTEDLALSTFAWGWHLEAGTAALRLMARGTLDRHPQLQLILGHWGELLLFWHQRADSLARIAGLERSITDYLRQNVWITASGMLDPALLQHALAITTPDRLLFSTDYPFQMPSREDIAQFLKAFPDDESRQQFASGNARKLFRIDEKA